MAYWLTFVMDLCSSLSIFFQRNPGDLCSSLLILIEIEVCDPLASRSGVHKLDTIAVRSLDTHIKFNMTNVCYMP